MHYIQKLAQEVVSTARQEPIPLPSYIALKQGLSQELARFDTRDFLPSARVDFVHVRQLFLQSDMLSTDDVARLATNVVALFDSYGGEGSRAVSRSFTFIHDSQLRLIVERDYRELSLVLFPSGAWKSVVIMAGSILEAVLFDCLTVNPSRMAAAVGASRAPKARDGSTRPLEKWTLSQLIDVTVEVGILPVEREKSIDQTLRDYRNFVHPKKEIRAAHPCSDAEAYMAFGSLNGVCNFLANNVGTKTP